MQTAKLRRLWEKGFQGVSGASEWIEILSNRHGGRPQHAVSRSDDQLRQHLPGRIR